MKIYFATHNKNKLKEIAKIIPSGFELLGLDELNLHEDIPETADTIEENSLMKTKYVFDKHQVACFGDDTGLEVAALNGAPGVFSARYAGPKCDSNENMALLLKNLEGEENRKARFKTVITYIDAKGIERQFTGIVNGEITKSQSGEKGFGYDPIFLPEGCDKTFAEMTSSEKNKISHRARAFRQLITFLEGAQ
ncbi:MAG: RdgB/HAM1 family non-canonical purine NTP pyrophosphatase [Cyclobacteriaceae bacterium]